MVHIASVKPARRQIAPTINLQRQTSPHCQSDRYNRIAGIKTHTVTGNAKIALTTLKFKDLSFIFLFYFIRCKDSANRVKNKKKNKFFCFALDLFFDLKVQSVALQCKHSIRKAFIKGHPDSAAPDTLQQPGIMGQPQPG
jgi:hypothetical protein